MKTRIIDTLQSIAVESHPLSKEFQNILGLTEEGLKQRAQEVLRNILHKYDSFAVCTIDSFFQKVVRTFAREIGVQGGFQVELDQKKVISDTVDKLLLEVGNDKNLTAWLTNFAIYKITDGKNWDSKNDIKSLSDELFREFFIQKKHIIFDKVEDENFLKNYLKNLENEMKSFESSMMSLGKKATAIMTSHNLLVADFTQGQRGVGSYFDKISHGDINEPNSYVYKALNDNAWYGKKSEKKDEIESALTSGLFKCLESIIDFHEKHYVEYFTSNSVIKNIYTLGILSKVNKYLLQYRDENDTLLISDFPVFLNQIINDSDTPYIYEKIGSKYKNYLIDEFQDTSGLQWNNFKPLVKDSNDANNFNMIVGDIKQSIYRWRGGDWKLLLEGVQNEIGEDNVALENLNTNWRSRKNIIDFNNALFESAPTILYDKLVDSSLEVHGVESLKNAYSDAYQQIADKDNVEGGLVSVNFFESKGSDFDENSLSLMIEQIEKLQEANYKLKDIAILVRSANEAKKVTDALIVHEHSNPNSKYRYDIISNESLYLKNSPVVNLIIQSMRFMMDSTESVNIAQLDYANKWHLNSSEENIELILKSKQNKLNSLSLVDLVEELIRVYDLGQHKNQLAYLLAFQDAILDYSKNKSAGIEGFLLWWEENNKRAIQVSESQDGIKLMTIHKSKGLQFKTVILPFCTWSIDHSTGGNKQNILWCDTTGKKSFEALPFLPMKYVKTMKDSMFSKDYMEEKAKAYMDNLNLLYVACTRAEEVLHLIGQKSKNNYDLTNVSGLLYNHLSKDESTWNPEALKFQSGNMVEFSVYEADLEYQEVQLNNIITHPWNERKDLQARHHDFWFDENVKASISEGNIIHWIFSNIKNASELDSSVQRAKIEFDLDEVVTDSIHKKLEQFLINTNVSNWFSEDLVIKNEMDIIDPNGKVMRPDRVVINGNEAVVIDFKTGIEREDHKKQVRSYQGLLRDMGYEKVTGFLLYINEQKVVDVA